MSDPVSWFVIEPGWKVVTSDGEEAGTVQEVLGDTTLDIFDGLAVASGVLSRAKYVSSDRVGTIVEGRVELVLSAEELERLDEEKENPPGAIRADLPDA
jgi:hypothetical protein